MKKKVSIGLMALMCFLLMCSLTACISVKGLNSGYNKLSSGEKKLIVDYAGKVEELGASDSIYRISAKQLREYIQCHESVIVYEYLPYCSSEDCINPLELERYCKDKNYKLCVVTSVYDGIFGLKGLSVPVLAINNDYYGTNLQIKYTRRFYDELTETDFKERGDGRFHYFQNGRFVRTMGSVKEFK